MQGRPFTLTIREKRLFVLKYGSLRLFFYYSCGFLKFEYAMTALALSLAPAVFANRAV